MILAHGDAPILRVHGQVALVKKLVQITPEQETIRDLVTLYQRIRLDVCSFKYRQRPLPSGILGWGEHARVILDTASHAADLEARKRAIDLIHRLGARGYFEFRDLLPEGAPA